MFSSKYHFDGLSEDGLSRLKVSLCNGQLLLGFR
jgi:hypothetical protein